LQFNQSLRAKELLQNSSHFRHFVAVFIETNGFSILFSGNNRPGKKTENTKVDELINESRFLDTNIVSPEIHEELLQCSSLLPD